MPLGAVHPNGPPGPLKTHEAGLEARGPLEPYFFRLRRRASMFSPSIRAEKAMAA
jgi:hypothetical protein